MIIIIFLEICLEYQYMHGAFYNICAAIRELRIACTVAQMEREGGISPRVSPLAQVCIVAKLIYVVVTILHILNECNGVSFK